MYEYRIFMEANRLKVIDREYEMHLQAWLNWNVQATKKSGKGRAPVFRTFKQFFDREKLIKGEDGSKVDRNRDILNVMKKQKERREQNGKL